MGDANDNSSTTSTDKDPKDIWMVRACHLYDDEYSDCTSIRSRFQQYFVFGKFEDCSPWKHDSNNCYKWKKDRNIAAVEEIIRNEEERRRKRLVPHYNNPVWENRNVPPPDWNAPLPPFLADRLKGTYLEIKSQQMKEGKNLTPDRLCVIL